MRWPWQRPTNTSTCGRARLLPSATAGIAFEAVYTITWRAHRRAPSGVEAAVRAHVHTTALKAAAEAEAADLSAAQDRVNAALPHRHRTQHYRLLGARATLRLSAADQDLLRQRQTDEDRVRRLRFLKAHLYDHPDLVVLDRLEHHNPGALDDDHVAELQRLARLITSCDRWWTPLMQQWEQLGQGFTDTDRQQQAMLALLDALKSLNGGGPPAPTGVPADPSRRAHP
ncbi:hypothetical protein [Streptomyces coelicoflavus]|uniref:hypothetical protein n=1 Tax=Streptomyces coelicoflavus TaxID=285562 RepID=UPI002E25DCDF